MNERIEELSLQCIRYKLIAEGARSDFDYKKFAELIVLEMCNVLDQAQWDKGEDWVCADGTRIIEQVKEHFGVEE